MEATIEDFLEKIIVDKETADFFQEIASTSSQNMKLFATFGRLLPLHKLTITSEDEQLTLGGVSIAYHKALQKIISEYKLDSIQNQSTKRFSTSSFAQKLHALIEAFLILGRFSLQMGARILEPLPGKD
ncbi:hypothetical protein ACTFIW_003749 [Dictyostelium discoideum]